MDRKEAMLICPQLAQVRLNPPGPVDVPKYTDQWAKRLAYWNKNPVLPNGEKC